jgi:hypothetical protein
VFQLIRGGRDPLQIKPTLQVLRGWPSAACSPARRWRTGRRLRLPAPRRTPPAIPRRCPDPHPADRRRRPRHHRPRHGLRLPTTACWPNSTTTAPPWRAFRGRVRRPQSRRAQAGRPVARRRRRRPGRGARQASATAAARGGAAACRRHARGARYQQMPAASASASMPWCRADRGRGRTAQPRRDPGPQPRPARGHLRRAAYLALLQQYPQALQKVAELVSSSSWAAELPAAPPDPARRTARPAPARRAPDWSRLRAQLDDSRPG